MSFIEDIKYKIILKKENKQLKAMDKKYGDAALETDDWKFIWGVKSWDDISGCDANMYTMNDIDIFYDKQKHKYYLDIETAYRFETYEDECRYLQYCLNAFTTYMNDNNLDKNKKPMLFMSQCTIDNSAESIEELYTNFRMFVMGYKGV